MMKSYTITVNGTAYDVTVEEGQGSAPAAAPAAAPTAAPKAAPQEAPKAAPKAASAAGAVEITASVPGKVQKIEASVGQTVSAGDNVVIIESMKMEIPVVAPQDGVIASIDVSAGDDVENGDILACMN